MGGRPVEAFLLDTHVWIWLAMGVEMRPELVQILGQAQLSIAAISTWELAMLEAKGRVVLQRDCLSWINESLRRTGVGVVGLSPEIGVDSTRLPGVLHGDPADRLIVATARAENAVLVTRDEKLLAYGSLGFVSVLRA